MSENTNVLITSRVMGVLLGIAAGDRNGGPQRLALRVCKTLVGHRSEQNENVNNNNNTESKSSFDLSAIATAYKNWFLGPPHDTTKAFDTGSQFHLVFQLATSKSLELQQASQQIFEKTNSAGIAPAHRNAVLAMSKNLSEDQLREAARQECQLTHFSEISVECAQAVVLLCRRLILGQSLKEALDEVSKKYVKHAHLKRVLNSNPPWTKSQLDSEGYGPNVIQAALYFLLHTHSFSEALAQSIEFAGPSNFCPVLVGSLGGALYGYGGPKGILQGDLNHRYCEEEILQEHLQVAKQLAAEWENEENEKTK